MEDLFDKLSPEVAAEIRTKISERSQKQFADHSWLEGYETAVNDFGIWKDGVQTIGCLSTPVKEVIASKRAEIKKALRD